MPHQPPPACPDSSALSDDTPSTELPLQFSHRHSTTTACSPAQLAPSQLPTLAIPPLASRKPKRPSDCTNSFPPCRGTEQPALLLHLSTGTHLHTNW